MPTNDWTDKLNTFKALVLHDAEEKRGSIMAEIEREYDERIDKKETELLEKAYMEIQRNIRDTQKKSNERILHTELDAKRALIVRREEIIAEVMDGAREKLAEFTKSAEYEKWLTDKTLRAVTELGEGAKTVYVSESDMRFKDSLGSIGKDITVEAASERDFIGGVKVINTDRRVASDYSFKEMLSEQKQKFLRESGLTLD